MQLGSFAGVTVVVSFVGVPLRRAMPSVGLWAGAYAEGMLDTAEALAGLWPAVDRSPLGSAAGYGVPLPLSRPGRRWSSSIPRPARPTAWQWRWTGWRGRTWSARSRGTTPSFWR